MNYTRKLAHNIEKYAQMLYNSQMQTVEAPGLDYDQIQPTSAELSAEYPVAEAANTAIVVNLDGGIDLIHPSLPQTENEVISQGDPHIRVGNLKDLWSHTGFSRGSVEAIDNNMRYVPFSIEQWQHVHNEVYPAFKRGEMTAKTHDHFYNQFRKWVYSEGLCREKPFKYWRNRVFPERIGSYYSLDVNGASLLEVEADSKEEAIVAGLFSHFDILDATLENPRTFVEGENIHVQTASQVNPSCKGGYDFKLNIPYTKPNGERSELIYLIEYHPVFERGGKLETQEELIARKQSYLLNPEYIKAKYNSEFKDEFLFQLNDFVKVGHTLADIAKQYQLEPELAERFLKLENMSVDDLNPAIRFLRKHLKEHAPADDVNESGEFLISSQPLDHLSHGNGHDVTEGHQKMFSEYALARGLKF